MLCKPDGLRCRGVNRISGEAEYRRSREERERDAGRMAVEPRARFLPRGKVLRFHGKSVHFPPRRQMYACRTSMTENTVSCFVFHVAELELFMKTAGAAVNC